MININNILKKCLSSSILYTLQIKQYKPQGSQHRRRQPKGVGGVIFYGLWNLKIIFHFCHSVWLLKYKKLTYYLNFHFEKCSINSIVPLAIFLLFVISWSPLPPRICCRIHQKHDDDRLGLINHLTQVHKRKPTWN